MDTPTAHSDPETDMSFERARGGADRTLVATIRTSGSLVGMGLTLFEIFSMGLQLGSPVIEGWAQAGGAALVLMGEALLVAAVLQHEQFLRDLRQRHERLRALGLMGPPADLPPPAARILALAIIVGGLLGLIVLALLNIGPG